MRTPELALETHAREELGITPDSLGQPLQAALSSFITFALGALLPLIPWFWWHGNGAVVASVIIGAAATVGVGSLLAAFTLQRRWRSAACASSGDDRRGRRRHLRRRIRHRRRYRALTLEDLTGYAFSRVMRRGDAAHP